MEVNLYCEKTNEEALDIIRSKKHSKIKLIANYDEKLTGKKQIEESRKMVGSNFICLVFVLKTLIDSCIENDDYIEFFTQVIENI